MPYDQPQPMVPLNWLLGPSAPGTISIDSSADECSGSFIAMESRTISNVTVYVQQIVGTSPVYKVEIQSVTNGYTTGTIIVAGAEGEFTPSGTGWVTIALDTPYALTQGDLYAITLKYASGTIDSSNRVVFAWRYLSYTTQWFPGAVETTNNWSTTLVRTNLPTLCPIFSGDITEPDIALGYNVAVFTGDEVGNKIVIPSGCTFDLSGAVVRSRNYTGAGTKVTLYESDGTTVIETFTISTDAYFSTTNSQTFYIPFPAQTLVAGTYYLCMAEVSEGAVNNQFSKNTYYSATHAEYLFGAGHSAVQRSAIGTGAFSEDATAAWVLTLFGVHGTVGGGGSTLIVVDD